MPTTRKAPPRPPSSTPNTPSRRRSFEQPRPCQAGVELSEKGCFLQSRWICRPAKYWALVELQGITSSTWSPAPFVTAAVGTLFAFVLCCSLVLCWACILGGVGTVAGVLEPVWTCMLPTTPFKAQHSGISTCLVCHIIVPR